MPKFVVGPTYRNEKDAFRRFDHPSLWSESHEVAVELLRHPLTTRILWMMFGLGFGGWVFAFLI